MHPLQQLVENVPDLTWIRLIAEGTSSDIGLCTWSAHPVEPVIVKVLRASAPAELQQRFELEAQLALTLDHPHLTKALARLNVPDVHGVLSEYLPGGDLRAVLTTYQGNYRSIAAVLSALSAAIGALHTAEIVHRDIKPENVLLSATGAPKLADLGSAFRQNNSRITAPDGMVGTVAYMSPEYLLDGVVAPANDLYALGVVGYELITGHLPFIDSPNVRAQIRQQVTEDPPAPAIVAPNCPPRLSELVMALLSRSPTARFAATTRLPELFQRAISPEGEPPTLLR